MRDNVKAVEERVSPALVKGALSFLVVQSPIVSVAVAIVVVFIILNHPQRFLQTGDAGLVFHWSFRY
jgi:hypothetical protein